MTRFRRPISVGPEHVAPLRFTDRVLVRCPASLPPAIDRAAAKNLMTASEYVRRIVIDRLNFKTARGLIVMGATEQGFLNRLARLAYVGSLN